MSGLEVLRPNMRLALRRKLASWSDRIEPEAVRLVEQHRELLPKRITNAQLSGLENIVNQAPNYQEVRAFLKNRATRAEKAGRLDIADYWNDLMKVLDNLNEHAEKLWTDLDPAGITDRQHKAAIATLHIYLTREYVQHQVSHSLYLGNLARRG